MFLFAITNQDICYTTTTNACTATKTGQKHVFVIYLFFLLNFVFYYTLFINKNFVFVIISIKIN
jgi:hypothetical protein